jgi:hypothetical protein
MLESELLVCLCIHVILVLFDVEIKAIFLSA